VDRRPTGKRPPPSRGNVNLGGRGSHSKSDNKPAWGRPQSGQQQQRGNMSSLNKKPMENKSSVFSRQTSRTASPASHVASSSPVVRSSPVPTKPTAVAATATAVAAVPSKTPEPASSSANLDPLRHESDPKIDKEINLMIEEYTASRDHEEAAYCVRDLPDPSCYYVVVLRSVLLSTERKEKDQETIAMMLNGLSSCKALESSHFEKGFERCLTFLPDVAIDVPFAPKVYGQLFARGVENGWMDSYSNLFKWVKELDDDLLRGDIVGSALETGLKTKGVEELSGLLKNAGVVFADVFTGKNVEKFVGKFGLEDLRMGMQ